MLDSKTVLTRQQYSCLELIELMANPQACIKNQLVCVKLFLTSG
jgi:hypothetical protein